MRANGIDVAGQLALQAIANGTAHPSVLNLAAQAKFRTGQISEAIVLLRQAEALDPTDPNILNSLAICLQSQGDGLAALDAYNRALAMAPALAAAQCNRAGLLKELGDINGARAAYVRTIELDPHHADALAGLAWLEAEAGNGDAAEALAKRALSVAPQHVLGRLAAAAAALQRRDFVAAEAIALPLVQDGNLSPVNRAIALGLAGDILDARGETPQAFAAYSASNAMLKAVNEVRYEAPGFESALAQADRLAEWFAATNTAQWRDAPRHDPDSGDPSTHVFLVGFPRSGTTLLENVLAAHPQVVSLEERDPLAAATADYLTSNDGLERLAQIDVAEAEQQRQAYWLAVRGAGIEPAGKVFIDKMPLASVQLPLVAKLFPTARILFARRDPRDVVVSCFRRRFGMNPAMYELLTLEGAAAFYDAVMRLSAVYRQALDLPQQIVRYERLVEDFEATARAACDFLGLEWHADMVDFAAKARARGVATPSAAQVAKGLNREGQGVWLRYRDQLAPVLPTLEPWVREFRYEAS